MKSKFITETTTLNKTGDISVSYEVYAPPKKQDLTARPIDRHLDYSSQGAAVMSHQRQSSLPRVPGATGDTFNSYTQASSEVPRTNSIQAQLDRIAAKRQTVPIGDSTPSKITVIQKKNFLMSQVLKANSSVASITSNYEFREVSSFDQKASESDLRKNNSSIFEPQQSKMYSHYNDPAVVYQKKPVDWNRQAQFLNERREVAMPESRMATQKALWGLHEQYKSQLLQVSEKVSRAENTLLLQNPDVTAKTRNPILSRFDPSVIMPSNQTSFVRLKRMEDLLQSVPQPTNERNRHQFNSVKKQTLSSMLQNDSMHKYQSMTTQCSQMPLKNHHISRTDLKFRHEESSVFEATDESIYSSRLTLATGKPDFLVGYSSIPQVDEKQSENLLSSRTQTMPMSSLAAKQEILLRKLNKNLENIQIYAGNASVERQLIQRELAYKKRRPARRPTSAKIDAVDLEQRLKNQNVLNSNIFSASQESDGFKEAYDSCPDNLDSREKPARVTVFKTPQQKQRDSRRRNKKIIDQAVTRALLPRIASLTCKEDAVDFKSHMQIISSKDKREYQTPALKARLSKIYEDMQEAVQGRGLKTGVKNNSDEGASGSDSSDTNCFDSKEKFYIPLLKDGQPNMKKLLKKIQKYKNKLAFKRWMEIRQAEVEKINISGIMEKINADAKNIRKMEEFENVEDPEKKGVELMKAIKRREIERSKEKYREIKEYISYLEDEPFIKHTQEVLEKINDEVNLLSESSVQDEVSEGESDLDSEKARTKALELEAEKLKEKTQSYGSDYSSGSELDERTALQTKIRKDQRITKANMPAKRQPVRPIRRKSVTHETDNSFLFDEYVNLKTQQKKECSADFYSRYEDFLISQSSFNSAALNPEITSSRLVYLNAIKKSSEISLPLLSKIRNKLLGLNQYTINMAHCEALREVFKTFPDIVEKFHLENCGLDYQALAHLVESASYLKVFHEIAMKQQDIGIETVKMCSRLFGAPGKLTSLKLVSCRLNMRVAEDFFHHLLEKSFIRDLSLVDFEFTGKTFGMLSKFFSENMFLEELDISYCQGISSQSFTVFFEQLKNNKRLRSLNLAWCPFIEDQKKAAQLAGGPAQALEKKLKQEFLQSEANPRQKQAARAQAQKNVDRERMKMRKGDLPILNSKGNAFCEIALFKLPNKVGDSDVRYAKENNLKPEDLEILSKREFLEKGQPKKWVSIPTKDYKPAEIQQTPRSPESRKNSSTERSPRKLKSSREPEEEVSEAAMNAVEAIYKFIRRNPNLQHIDLTHTNLNQVMLARIALAVKCSSSIVGAHFSDNPGVTPDLKEYLRIRMKCAVPKLPPQAHNLSRSKILEQSELKHSLVLEKQLANPQITEWKNKQIKYELVESARNSQAREMDSVISNSLANESITLRLLNSRIAQVKGLSNVPQEVDKSASSFLVFNRVLNHKFVMPGSGQWRMLEDSHQECWVCNKYVFTYLFWNPLSIASNQISKKIIPTTEIEKSLQQIDVFDKEEKVKIQEEAERMATFKASQLARAKAKIAQPQAITESQTASRESLSEVIGPPELMEIGEQDLDIEGSPQRSQHTVKEYFTEGVTDIPVIYGHFSDWLPRKMMPIKELTNIFRPAESPDFFEIAKERKLIASSFENEDELSQKQRKILEQLRVEYENDFRLNWRRLVTSDLFFKEPQFTNYELFREEDELLKQLKFFKNQSTFIELAPIEKIPLYVYPCLMKPGLHFYAVKQTKKHRKKHVGEDQSQLVPKVYLHKTVSGLREERIGNFRKKFLQLEAERQFYFRTSVWSPFVMDTKKTLKACLNADLPSINMSKIIKNDIHIAKTLSVVERYFGVFKEVHLWLLGETEQYPYVTWLDFVNFCQDLKLCDENLTMVKMDVIFLQVSSYVKSRNGLNRAELIELLIRVAKEKFCTNGTTTLQEAVKKLVTQNIKPFGPLGLGQEYREKHFWNNQVNDILQANQQGLRVVYKTLLKNRRELPMDVAIDVMTDHLPTIMLGVKQARRCFGLSRMTVIDDTNKPDQYSGLKFVEFLEYMCRSAMTFYDESASEFERQTPMNKRIQRIVSDVLSLKDLRLNEVVINTCLDSEEDLTDEDY